MAGEPVILGNSAWVKRYAVSSWNGNNGKRVTEQWSGPLTGLDATVDALIARGAYSVQPSVGGFVGTVLAQFTVGSVGSGGGSPSSTPLSETWEAERIENTMAISRHPYFDRDANWPTNCNYIEKAIRDGSMPEKASPAFDSILGITWGNRYYSLRMKGVESFIVDLYSVRYTGTWSDKTWAWTKQADLNKDAGRVLSWGAFGNFSGLDEPKCFIPSASGGGSTGSLEYLCRQPRVIKQGDIYSVSGEWTGAPKDSKLGWSGTLYPGGSAE